MKILLIGLHDGYAGGAGGAISMQRLHRGYQNARTDSSILAVRTTSPESTKLRLSRTEIKINTLLAKATSRFGLNDVLNMNARKIERDPLYLDADIVHVHRVDKVFSYLALPSLSAKKPLVLTLHDMWFFSGHCQYSFDCERWKTGCGSCPYPDHRTAVWRDSSHLEWKLKEWAYRRSNLGIIAPSKWLCELAQQSILGHFPIHHVANGIDTEVYKPLDPAESRTLLKLPPGKKVLMFGATDLTRHHKGADLLMSALQQLPKALKAEMVLLLMGRESRRFVEAVGIETVELGYTRDEVTKARAYSAADLFILPSRIDNVPLMLQESMACGTPMVAFRTGGIPDLVRPGTTGYLAEPENTADLGTGIARLLEDDVSRARMSRQCREIALREYALDPVAHQTLAVYEQLIQAHPSMTMDREDCVA